MNKLLTLTFLCVLLCGCGIVTNGVEQEIRERSDYSQSLATYVWWHRKIVWSRYDPIETVTDSLVLCRQTQAENIYTALKKMK